METRRLRYFLAVAEAGHITRAAAALGMQQPPLSQQIHALEAQLGVALFTRHPKGVSLTDAGRGLQAEARRIVDSVDLLARHMRGYVAGQRGALAVGFTSSAAAHAFTPTVLRACRREYPDVDLQIVEDNAAELIAALDERRLQFGFVRVPVARPAGLVFETLLSEPAVLALPLDHALAQRFAAGQEVPLEALRDEALILVRRPGAPGLYANLLALLEQRGVAVRIVAEVERMMSNINLVASGAGISIVPASMQGAQAHSVVYRPLPRSAAIQAPITLVYRDDAANRLADNFLQLARRVALTMTPPSPPASAAAAAR